MVAVDVAPLPAVRSRWQLCGQNELSGTRFSSKTGLGTPFAFLGLVGLSTRRTVFVAITTLRFFRSVPNQN
ncbi:hypothetical protein RMSM_03735 [Rhodopirellula maiorica SM1]|uniref:Uncharacterized protein n=1 Tax=Rhodopirellula maiorica SM1 TaxID=1265738 RepID=M5RJ63_9BACT|nr:hypothetical protein RMSM_03735 [Rhodopirellula maiorica SM1]